MSVVGIGVDMIAIQRIEKVLQRRGHRFAEKILSHQEFQAFKQHSCPVAYLAKRFAVKEAVLKAMQCGIGRGIALREIECLNQDNGAPFVRLLGEAASQAESMGVAKVWVSVSDEKEFAVAFVTLSSVA